MQLDFRKNRKFNKPKQQAQVVRDFSKLQKTELDQDKIPFEVFHKAKNVIHKGLNAEVRKGVTKLGTVTDILGIGFQDRDDETAMLGMVQTTLTSKIVEIDRTAGTTADITTAITGTGTPTFASLRQAGYVCNGEADIEIVTSAGATGTPIVMPSSGIARFVASDTQSLWVAQTDGILRSSAVTSVDVTTADFVVSGTAINRAVLVQTRIVDFKSLKENGSYICVSGKDRIEIHRRPDFASNGITTFPEDVPTLVQSYANIGVENNDAVMPWSNGFFVKPNDGTLYFIAEGVKTPQEFTDDLQEMERLDWTDCVMGLDIKKKLLLITGKDTSSYEVTLAFNIKEQNFSRFENIWSRQWISDSDNIYYLNSFNFDIQDAFASTYVTDNGVKIDWELETASVQGNLENYWKTTDFFMDVIHGENIDVTASLIVDGKIGGNKSDTWSKTFSLIEVSSAFTGGIAGFGAGVFGGIEAGLGMYHEDADLYSEYYDFNTKVFKTFKRAFLRLSGSSSNIFKVRGLGMNIEPTARKARSISMSS
jgi:hypothetical protein